MLTTNQKFSKITITIIISIIFSFFQNTNSLNAKSKNKISRIFLRPFGKFITVEHFLKSNGKSIHKIDKDLILIKLKIYTLEKTHQKSYEQNFSLSKKFDEIIKKLKIPLKNVRTISFDTKEKYREIYNDDLKKFEKFFDGFEIFNEILIKVDDLRIASDLIQGAKAIGNLIVTSVNFDVDRIKIREFAEDVLIQATENALKKAKIVSNSLGVVIDDVKDLEVYLKYPQVAESGKTNFLDIFLKAFSTIWGKKEQEDIEGSVEIRFLTLKR